ncbi:DUF2231 domain-containing protein [Pelagibacterium sp. H642]|uniref:DUF2231 domain-containing protein n=1 Tax=Pelagibacterium sp. H642 TaxID=1881069 RepID=UPI0028156C9F|nr:DUF2231 domain-containing protein [Pelagibacterium sp. H642]WMT92887.1 DUF2231 domain-containing protein [Pelagibacterium sp. H642]
MAKNEFRGVATRAKLAGHPIHPMLIPFPIALLVATFASDLAFWGTADVFWARASFWLLAAALVMSAAAAIAGFADFLGNSRIRSMSDAWQHMIGNVVAVVLALANFILRWNMESSQGVLPWGIVLSALIVLILLFTGWKGGSLVYHHRIGMHPEEPVGADPKRSNRR